MLNDISIGSAVFAQLTADSLCTFYTMSRPFPLKIVLRTGSGLPANIWFLGTTRGHNPHGISIGSAVFAGLTVVIDRPTDYATPSVTIGRIYVSYV